MPIQIYAASDIRRRGNKPTWVHADSDVRRLRYTPTRIYADSDKCRLGCTPTRIYADSDMCRLGCAQSRAPGMGLARNMRAHARAHASRVCLRARAVCSGVRGARERARPPSAHAHIARRGERSARGGRASEGGGGGGRLPARCGACACACARMRVCVCARAQWLVGEGGAWAPERLTARRTQPVMSAPSRIALCACVCVCVCV